jgi:hypothetical protein
MAENGRIRLLAYTFARPYLKDESMSPYEFWPMDGDPTAEEINQEQQERLEKESEAAAAARERILTKFKQRNGGL